MAEEEKSNENVKIKLIKPNPVAVSISNINTFILIVNLIFSILLIAGGISILSEEGSFVVFASGVISLIYSFVIYVLLSGYAEIIKLLNRISQK